MPKESDKYIGSFEELDGRTLYIVNLYSSKGATETLEQKLRKMIRRDAEMLLMEEEMAEKPSAASDTDNNK